ncbi:hypothetical protein J19TS2_15460 [Cohnella xylanilytica]|nr:hypothetical protein J19TS2_15460 [Cohnella xylanilytica]
MSVTKYGVYEMGADWAAMSYAGVLASFGWRRCRSLRMEAGSGGTINRVGWRETGLPREARASGPAWRSGAA